MTRPLTFQYGIEFGMEEWLESVEGEIIEVSAPSDGQLGAVASRMYSSPTSYKVTYCKGCREYVLLVKDYAGHVGRCPCCERQPGVLELGTTKDCCEV